MDLTEKLLDKSKEAFTMAIEIYNKPTIKYRIEGFSFFICNAWELMLKAYMIKAKGEIVYIIKIIQNELYLWKTVSNKYLQIIKILFVSILKKLLIFAIPVHTLL